MEIKDFQHYCTGCGLCHSEQGVLLEKKDTGFNVAKITENNYEFCSKFCPASGNAGQYLQDGVWGTILDIKGGYAIDESIRYKGSSGGVLTATACYLLQSKKVDGVIQTKVSDKGCFSTETICSESVEDVLSCSGSRYSLASPLANLSQQIKQGKKYAVIARPCDILALRNYINNTGKYQKEIKYLLSFFCAGTPSDVANDKMLTAMGVQTKKCVNLQYRGCGWPGYATATELDGKTYQMEYKTSWSKFLGRDIMPMCKLCVDGTGAAADFSCGDYWEMDNGKPDFSEHDGRNMILIRTEKGHELFDELVEKKILKVMKFSEGKENIHLIQPAQYTRVTTILPKIQAMRLMGRHTPSYNKKLLKSLSSNIKLKEKSRVFYGTIKRIIKGKI